MLGYIRFTLAFCVLISHLPSLKLDFNVGVMAVICFYFISGYLMKLSYNRFRSHHQPVWSFYRDRALKLMPLYFIVLIGSVLSFNLFGKSESIWPLNHSLSNTQILLNSLLLPANFVFEPFTIRELLPHPIIPPAWSLSSEAQFYLLLPLIALLPRIALILLIATTCLIQFSSFFFDSSHVFNSDNMGYRYIFGVLTVFLFGYCYAHNKGTLNRKAAYSLWSLYLLFLVLLYTTSEAIHNAFVLEVLVGGSIALPLLTLGVWHWQRPSLIKVTDKWLGDLAYPLFLVHFLVFYLVEKVMSYHPSDTHLFTAASIAGSIGVSVGLCLIQRRIEAWRIKVRHFDSLMR